jgi:hypothetical protein
MMVSESAQNQFRRRSSGSDAFTVQTRQRSTWRDGEGTKPTIQGSGILAAGKRSVVPPHALKNPAATITSLATSNQRYLRWPTDKWGNPHKVGTGHHTAEEAVALYRRDLIAGSHPLKIDDVRPGLERQGFDLLV